MICLTLSTTLYRKKATEICMAADGFDEKLKDLAKATRALGGDEFEMNLDTLNEMSQKMGLEPEAKGWEAAVLKS